jgi:hypothetical protein
MYHPNVTLYRNVSTVGSDCGAIKCIPAPNLSCTLVSYNPTTHQIVMNCPGTTPPISSYYPGDPEYDYYYITYVASNTAGGQGSLLGGKPAIFLSYDGKCIDLLQWDKYDYTQPISICEGDPDYDICYAHYVRTRFTTHSGKVEYEISNHLSNFRKTSEERALVFQIP